MAIRLNPERLFGLAIFVLFLVWAVLVATGCMTDVDVPITPVDLSDTTTTTTTVPVSIEHTDGPVTVITLAGATPWTIAGLVGLLGLFQARRQNTATGLVDRMAGAIKDVHEGHVTIDPRMDKIVAIKKRIASDGVVAQSILQHLLRPRVDRRERLLRDRLARLKK